MVKWKGAWVYHFKDEQENLLDHQYKAIICYNGIHHFTSTKLLSLESKNQAVPNLMVEMSQNLKEVSTGLHGFKELKNFIKLTHDQLKVVQRDPPTKFTAPTGPSGPSSSGPSAAAPSTEEKFKYSCDQCDKRFQRSNELQAHITFKHGEGYQCPFCQHEPFASQAALNVHKSTKHGKQTAKIYNCDSCDYTSNRKDAVLAHKIKAHNLVLSEEEKVKCPNADKGCTKTFNTQEQCRRHLRLICQKTAEVKCKHEGCDRKFKNEVQMLTHYKIHTEEGKEWQCQICDKQFVLVFSHSSSI